MAKALIGYVGGSDTRLLAEVAVLRRRVRDLEAEVLRLAAENDAILAASSTTAEDIIALDTARESVSVNAHALA